MLKRFEKQAEAETRRVQPAPAAMRAGATVIDLSANPDDFSPLINHLVTTVKESRAADQKVIVMLGECHSNIADVSRAELLRQGLRRAGVVERPVIAVEVKHNFLQSMFDEFYPEAKLENFHAAAKTALTVLRDADTARYNRAQAMAHAAWDWPYTPITNLVNFNSWIATGEDIRMVDLAKTDKSFLDTADPATAAFIDEYAAKEDLVQKARYIHTTSKEGVRLRNLWMAKETRGIMKDAQLMILKTGLYHVGGQLKDGYLYKHSLHAQFAKAANDNIRVITVFPENDRDTFANTVPPDGQQAMNNPDTIILRGGPENSHFQDLVGSFESEIATLDAFAHAANLPAPEIRNEYNYRALLEKNKASLTEELKDIIRGYGPHCHQNTSITFPSL